MSSYERFSLRATNAEAPRTPHPRLATAKTAMARPFLGGRQGSGCHSEAGFGPKNPGISQEYERKRTAGPLRRDQSMGA